jgi:hypothetical protein
MIDAYEIELADGKLVRSRDVVPDCVLELYDHHFSIYLIPMELRSFGVIVGMDWLVKNKAEIVCHERLVRITLANDETLLVQGGRLRKRTKDCLVYKSPEVFEEAMLGIRCSCLRKETQGAANQKHPNISRLSRGISQRFTWTSSYSANRVSYRPYSR